MNKHSLFAATRVIAIVGVLIAAGLVLVRRSKAAAITEQFTEEG